MRFVCEPCRDGKDHTACENIVRTGRADSTWCDCGHRPIRPDASTLDT